MEQTLTLSDEAYEQAEMYSLGRPLSEYPPQSDKMKKPWLRSGSLASLAGLS